MIGIDLLDCLVVLSVHVESDEAIRIISGDKAAKRKRGQIYLIYTNRDSGGAMHKVRHHAEERLRTHLRKRHKIRNRKAGFVHFPRRDLI